MSPKNSSNLLNLLYLENFPKRFFSYCKQHRKMSNYRKTTFRLVNYSETFYKFIRTRKSIIFLNFQILNNQFNKPQGSPKDEFSVLLCIEIRLPYKQKQETISTINSSTVFLFCFVCVCMCVKIWRLLGGKNSLIIQGQVSASFFLYKV